MIKFTILMHRKPSMTHQEFMKYHREQHAQPLKSLALPCPAALSLLLRAQQLRAHTRFGITRGLRKIPTWKVLRRQISRLD
jgi:predicted NAD/FAD-binding protein